MKARLLNKYQYLIIILVFVGLAVCGLSDSDAQPQLLTRKEALLIAESSLEAELFYKLNDGRLQNCVNKEVIKPCESDWVTCVEDAWVVQFTVGDICPIIHDGRLGITFLIDAITGRIISRFPEAEYLAEPGYCLEDYDCVSVVEGETEAESCQNFIFGQLSLPVEGAGISCKCVQNACQGG